MARQIALDLIQVVGLMLPVVFLTMRFLQRNTSPETDKETESLFVRIFLLMLASLTASGFLLLLGVLDTAWASSVVFFGVVAMMAFFVFFGIFIYYFVQAMKPEYKQHLT
ncbi:MULTISPECIES: hypothetical protein [Halorubrum]|uniref:Uncharacterized protein n=1 Tax=Halorubrum hochstenium ATCC 700873 TaxID=1227481 RepID=M0F8T7_9EURY|nr:MULTISPECIES: hypothetical protein [Halorubrum]ELZ55647.1 hypothetical protein C467_09224 [Halorubrum hochstenium ATCC 700873]